MIFLLWYIALIDFSDIEIDLYFWEGACFRHSKTERLWEEVLSGEFFRPFVLVYFAKYIYEFIYAFIQLVFILIYSVLGPGQNTGNIPFLLPIVRGLVLNQLWFPPSPFNGMIEKQQGFSCLLSWP